VPTEQDKFIDRLLAYDRALMATEVAEILGVSPDTIHRHCPHVLIGTCKRYRGKAVADWWLARERRAR